MVVTARAERPFVAAVARKPRRRDRAGSAGMSPGVNARWCGIRRALLPLAFAGGDDAGANLQPSSAGRSEARTSGGSAGT
jgi:hypothetical protein